MRRLKSSRAWDCSSSPSAASRAASATSVPRPARDRHDPNADGRPARRLDEQKRQPGAVGQVHARWRSTPSRAASRSAWRGSCSARSRATSGCGPTTRSASRPWTSAPTTTSSGSGSAGQGRGRRGPRPLLLLLGHGGRQGADAVPVPAGHDRVGPRPGRVRPEQGRLHGQGRPKTISLIEQDGFRPGAAGAEGDGLQPDARRAGQAAGAGLPPAGREGRRDLPGVDPGRADGLGRRRRRRCCRSGCSWSGTRRKSS